MKLMKTLCVGIIGFGFMGKVHTHAYRSLPFYFDPSPARIELAGVAATREDTLCVAREQWGFTDTTNDYRELCKRGDIDIIDCCVPNHLHHDILVAALENGKHVYMEKPLCTNMDEARAMVGAAASHPECITQMTFNYRFIPAIMRAKELLESGALGKLFTVRVAYLHASYINPNRPLTWRVDTARSGPGGALFDLGSHVIDLTRWLAGEFYEIHHLAETFIKERPVAADSPVKGPVDVDDVSILAFRLKNGAIGTLESSRMATGVQDEIRIELHGSDGAIRFNLVQPNYLEYYDARIPEGTLGGDRGFKHIECVGRYPKPAALPGPKATLGWERFHVQCIHNFVHNVVSGTPTVPDILDGARTQAVMDAALRSSAVRGPVLVEDI